MKQFRRAMAGLGVAGILLAGCGDPDEGGAQSILSAGPEPAGPDPFDPSVLTTYEITIDPADWDAMVADPADETYRRCAVAWRGETYADVAVRPAGNRSLIPGNPKPSLKLKFDWFVAAREFHRFSSLKLDAVIHDASMMKARLEYPVYAARGVPAPRYVHCRLYVNGAYKGLYGVEERVTREYVRKHFGRPVRQLYRWAASGTMHDLIWTGWDPITNYVPRMWIPLIEELGPEAEGVRELCYALHNDLPLVPGLLDVESFLNFIASETLLGEGDNYVAGSTGTRTANIRLYRPPTTGKYMILPWDCDQGFWRRETGITYAFENRVLTNRLILQNAANFERYRQILRELIAGPLDADRMAARVDFIFEQIKEAAFEDPYKLYTNESFVFHVEHIKQYVRERNAAFLPQLR